MLAQEAAAGIPACISLSHAGPPGGRLDPVAADASSAAMGGTDSPIGRGKDDSRPIRAAVGFQINRGRDREVGGQQCSSGANGVPPIR